MLILICSIQDSIASEREKKGEKIAAESKFKYQLNYVKDEISKKEVLTAVTQIKVGTGSVLAEVRCYDKTLFVDFTFDKVVPPTLFDPQSGRSYTSARFRLNEITNDSFSVVRSRDFNNVFTVRVGAVFDGNVHFYALWVASDLPITYDFALQFKTNVGDAYIEIPPYDKSIRKIVDACK